MVVDLNDNIILFAGYGPYTNNTAILLKYSSAGTVLWTNFTSGFFFNLGHIAIPVVDNGNNVLITASFTNSFNGSDYLTMKYSSAGVLVWTNTYNGSANGDDQANALAVDSVGNVFVTGSSWNGTNSDIATIKYQVSQSPIPLFLQKMNNQMVLSWSNAAFSLQSAPTVNGTFTNLTGATSPYTNLITGTQRYFRLISN
jgi:hypothetical protein